MFSTPAFPHLHCSTKYNQFADCVSKTIQICFDDQVAESQIREIVYQYFKENTLCSDGALELPTVPPTSLVGLPCSASFSSDANACVKTFQEKFAANKSDPLLCPWVTLFNQLVMFLEEFPFMIPGIFDLILGILNKSEEDACPWGRECSLTLLYLIWKVLDAWENTFKIIPKSAEQSRCDIPR